MTQLFQWYAVRTNIKCERRAELGLQAAGLDTCLPRETVWIARKRAREPRQRHSRPLLGRYLFVGVAAGEHRFRAISEVDGVEGILSDGDGKPGRVPLAAIVAFQQAEANGLFDKTVDRRLRLRPGQLVKVIGGPFAEHMVRVVAAPTDQRIELVFSLFGKETKGSATLANLEVVC